MDDADRSALRRFFIEDGSQQITRYMPFGRFRSLVNSGSVHMSPASFFSDFLEGHYSTIPPWPWIAKWNKAATVISCWTTAGDSEIRMWREYGRCKYAVAISTTVETLRGLFGPEFLIIKVTYVDDLRSAAIPRDHSLQPFCFKRKELFEWEQEVRVIGNAERGARIGSFRRVKVDLTELISSVTLAPGTDERFNRCVRRLLDGHGLFPRIRVAKVKALSVKPLTTPE